MALFPAEDFTNYQDMTVPQPYTLAQSFYETIAGGWFTAEYQGNDTRYTNLRGQRFTVFRFSDNKFVDAPCPYFCPEDAGLRIDLKPQFSVVITKK